jgi:hypothetical protein
VFTRSSSARRRAISDARSLRRLTQPVPTVALLASPLLGPGVWRPVCEELRAKGWTVVQTAAPNQAPQTWADVVEQLLSQLPAECELILVPHSNAGLYVPTLRDQRRVVGAVFVDAGLPPSVGSVPLAPPALVAQLATLAGCDGLLPPWLDWWPPADIAGLFGSADQQREVAAELPRLPLDYFRGEMPLPPGWDEGLPAAYLAFGETYAVERADAAKRGWPTRTLTGRHLHMLVDPAEVASAMVDLIGACCSRIAPL